MARHSTYTENLKKAVRTAYRGGGVPDADAVALGATPMERAAFNVVVVLISRTLDDAGLPVMAEVVAAEEFARLSQVSLETAASELEKAANDVLLYAVHNTAHRIAADLEKAAALDTRDEIQGVGEKATPRAIAVVRASLAVWYEEIAAKEEVAERLRTLMAGLKAHARQYEACESAVFRRLER